MAVFRVERNKGYTVMSNHHLRNKELTLKAKGLLSQMLSLPEDWDYTLAGLSQINRESIDAIRTAVWELEKAGYIKRRQGRDEKGKMTAIEYTIYEQPQPPDDTPPGLDKPILENPTPGKPTTENPMQLNKDIQRTDLPKKEKIITDEQSTHSIPILSPILHDPELLILDEPTNGLDPIGIAEVRDFIKELSAAQGKTILISSHILSEISLLADDIGIINNGVLLEESSMRELEKKNRKYILLRVSDIPKTTLILERQFHLTDYSVQDDHTLRLYDASLDMGEVNKVLVMQDITVMSSLLCNDTLEDYFKKITGGEGIA